MAGIPIQNALNTYYPKTPSYDSNCPVNQLYQSLPASSRNGESFPTYWETRTAGPTSMKHLYSGIPNWYPMQTITRPVGTLYEHDYSQFHNTGVGRGKRISYQYKPYPLTDRNVRETHEYADYILPYINIQGWQHHPVRRDSTVNSSMQNHPNPYVQDW